MAKPDLRLLLSAAFAVAITAAPAGAFGLLPSDLLLGAGNSFATTGDPNGGGASLRAVPQWRVTDKLKFGIEFFADDIGTEIVDVVDPADGISRGAVAQTHRWVYGGAWRADGELLSRGRWKSGVSGSWGYWRVEDDIRGRTQGAFSGIGFGASANIRRVVSRAQDLGMSVGYTRVFADRRAAVQRVDRYAYAALEWRWAIAERP
ncbi:MAG: hypothetical protein IT517_01455 [Burkholderiales bacterium]|nr:hypothetical protein [Burkholderiales bacterium]